MQNIITVYAEATPNPETMKFVLNRYILPDQDIDFPSRNEVANSPFATKLFEFPFVKSVYISNNFVTITKYQEEEWHEIIQIVKDFVKTYLEAGMDVVTVPVLENGLTEEEDSEITKKIKQILKDYIQPAVEQDGGAISYKDFDESNGTVTVSLKGSCSGCPSSMITLKSGIENLLKRMLPEVKEVVAAAD